MDSFRSGLRAAFHLGPHRREVVTKRWTSFCGFAFSPDILYRMNEPSQFDRFYGDGPGENSSDSLLS